MLMYTAWNPPVFYFSLLRLITITFFSFLSVAGLAQKYNFTHYDIENGLAQSQVLKIYQDNNHYLWFGSYGGASRFDGKEFVSYTKADGLRDNIVTAMLKDKSGKVWLGTEAGISCIVGKKIKTYSIPGDTDKSWIRNIIEDQNGKIWFTKKSKLYSFDKEKIKASPIFNANEYIVSLTSSRDGKVYAAVCGKGIVSFEANKWALEVPIQDSILITRIVPDKHVANKLYLLTPKQVYVADHGLLKPFHHPMLDTVREPYFSLEQDAEGILWVGTNNGAYYLRKNSPVHFVTANGFTNNSVNDIFSDFEDNIWLATDAAGVFKYDGNTFTSYDKFNGQSHIVMSMAMDDANNIWMGGFTNGLVKYSGKTFENIHIPSDVPYAQNINSIYSQPGKGLLIGTQHGLWHYNGTDFKHVTKGLLPEIVRCVITDRKGTIWMAAPRGCFYMDGAHAPAIVPGLQFSSMAVIECGKDSILTGTNHGIFLIKNKLSDKNFTVKALENSSILCLLKYKDIILAGTFGDGLFLIDLKSKKARKLNVKNGLYSNDVYSLIVDNHGIIWIGTGRGVNRISVDAKTLKANVLKDPAGKALIECNQNSIFKTGDSIWVGATKGLYIYNAATQALQNKKPFINIQAIKIFDQKAINGKLLPAKIFESEMPGSLKLNSFQNRIVISFRGIFFTNPDDVSYQYRLKGLDDGFSQPIKTNTIEYPSLFPGIYTFEVKAISGGKTSNIQSITFEITPPFYKTITFQLLMLILLIAGIVILQYYWNYRKARQKRVLEHIKHEEQLKIRRQTAEDFHDDIGNKLTRISILSDILNKKVDEQEIDQKNIIRQIKDNAATLYSGTKDILWALDPQSDNLYEILNHVNGFGYDLFENTGTSFHADKVDHKSQKVQLPMEYSRNISMIFKELISNILKHANASCVKLSTSETENGVKIILSDNGTGYDTNCCCEGRGLNNIKVRAKRINATIELLSEPGKGSQTILTLNLYSLLNPAS